MNARYHPEAEAMAQFADLQAMSGPVYTGYFGFERRKAPAAPASGWQEIKLSRLTYAEAAKKKGVCVASIRNWIKRGWLDETDRKIVINEKFEKCTRSPRGRKPKTVKE